MQLTRVGWNPDAAQAEIHTPDRVWHLQDVPPVLGRQLMHPQGRQAAAQDLTDDPRYRIYPDSAAAERTCAVRCDRCGQWRGRRHTCPAQTGARELDQTGPTDTHTVRGGPADRRPDRTGSP